MLTFDPELHEYRWNGQPVPSVTQVIGAVWPELYAHSSQYAMARGSAVHAAIESDIRGELADWMLTSEIEGYVQAARACRRDLGIEIELNETRLYSAIYGYAGTLDIKGRIGKRNTLLDWKSGNPGWQCGPQTAAYAQALQEMTGDVVTLRYGAWLHNDGTYNLIQYKNFTDDFEDFKAALRVLRRRRAA